MSVYVDKIKPVFGDGKRFPYSTYCHMISDDVEELKKFGLKIGLRPEWFQEKSSPHFDLTAGMRKKAVANGAIEVTDREIVAIIRKNREID